MLDFWKVLSDLIRRYTIADVASVFVVIEGLATVVAAVGAIIAVVVTKKIAKEQIEIAKKQNDISDKQADIAKQQNKIALFENRSIAYDKLINLFGIWNYFDKSRLDGLKAFASINSFQAYISLRELGKLDLNFLSDKEWFYFLSKQSDFFVRDINCIAQVLRLFQTSTKQKALLESIIENYKNLNDSIYSMKYPVYTVSEFEKIASEINATINTLECRELVVALNTQISFSDN